MIHPATELCLVNDTIGLGVFATAHIPAGTITWVRDHLDQVFTPEQTARLPAPYHMILDKFAFTDPLGRLVLCWDHARFINHSCEANCLTAGDDFEIAIRDIRAGEELTDDYGTLNLSQDFVCACQSSDCRRIIRPDDMERHAPAWDAKVESAFHRLLEIPQPLWTFLAEPDAVAKAVGNLAVRRSIRASYRRCA